LDPNTTNQQELLFQQPPQPQGDIIKKDVHDAGTPQTSTSNPEGRVKEMTDIPELDFNTLDEVADSVDLNFCLPGGLQGSIFSIIGDKKSGKSQIAQQLCVMLATGMPIVPAMFTGQRRRVLYVGMENDIKILAWRMRGICNHWDIPHNARELQENLHIIGGSEYLAKLQLLVDDKPCDYGITQWSQMIRKTGAELVVIDPLAMCGIAKGINSQATVITTFSILTDLAITYGCSFLTVFHTHKDDDKTDRPHNKSDDVSGSGGWTAYSKLVYNIYREKDESDPHAYLVCTERNEGEKEPVIYPFLHVETSPDPQRPCGVLVQQQPQQKKTSKKSLTAAATKQSGKSPQKQELPTSLLDALKPHRGGQNG
jgi:RecA-family ATPase